MTMHIQILVASLFLSSALSAQAGSFPEIGKPAPEFTVKDHEGKKVSVGGKSETWTVLAFYPKALTGG